MYGARMTRRTRATLWFQTNVHTHRQRRQQTLWPSHEPEPDDIATRIVYLIVPPLCLFILIGIVLTALSSARV